MDTLAELALALPSTRGAWETVIGSMCATSGAARAAYASVRLAVGGPAFYPRVRRYVDAGEGAESPAHARAMQQLACHGRVTGAVRHFEAHAGLTRALLALIRRALAQLLPRLELNIRVLRAAGGARVARAARAFARAPAEEQQRTLLLLTPGSGIFWRVTFNQQGMPCEYDHAGYEAAGPVFKGRTGSKAHGAALAVHWADQVAAAAAAQAAAAAAVAAAATAAAAALQPPSSTGTPPPLSATGGSAAPLSSSGGGSSVTSAYCADSPVSSSGGGPSSRPVAAACSAQCMLHRRWPRALRTHRGHAPSSSAVAPHTPHAAGHSAGYATAVSSGSIQRALGCGT